MKILYLFDVLLSLLSFVRLLLGIVMSPLMKFYCYLGDLLLFRCILPTTFLYNANVEDPRMDRRVLNLTPRDHVLTIASAGCNSFDYLIEGARVTSADLNPAQIALVELKIACCLLFEHETFFQIFGAGDLDTLRRFWWDSKSGLRSHPRLSDRSRAFWDSNLPRNSLVWWYHGLIDCHLLYYKGASGLLSRGFQAAMWAVGLLDISRRGCAGLPLPADAEKRGKRGLKMMTHLFNLFQPIVIALQGVPKRQYDLALVAVPNLPEIVLNRVYQCCIYGQTKPTDLSHPHPKGNYFYHAFMYGRYRDQIACPRYLQPGNYKTLRQAFLTNRFHLFSGRLEEAAKQAIVRKDSFTVFSLLDSMDWMTREDATNMLATLFAAADKTIPLARVFWRSSSPSFNLPALCYTSPKPVDDSDDRLGTYLSTWIGSLPTAPITYTIDEKNAEHSVVSKFTQLLEDENKKQGKLKKVLTLAKSGIKIVTFPLRSALKKGNKAKQNSATPYSGRDSLFVAGPLLMQYIQAITLRMSTDQQNNGNLNNDGRLVWVDIGGGLRNIEFLGCEFILRYFKQVWIVDFSLSSLSHSKMKNRIQELGLNKVVKFLHLDFTSPLSSALSSIKRSSSDIVTLSYSLSVQPPEECLTRAVEWLTPGGVLGVGDLTISRAEKLSDRFARWWYRRDGMDLDPSVRSILFNYKELSNPLFTQWPQRTQGSFVVPNHYVQIAFRRNSTPSGSHKSAPSEGKQKAMKRSSSYKRPNF